MELIRRYSLLVTAAALACAVLLGAITDRPVVSADAASSLARAASYFDSTVVLARNARPRGLRGDQLAIGLGYLERLRLGLGSPFRLADEAMRDPRLDQTAAPRVAWAVLARLRRGDAYVVDPSVLDDAGPRGTDGRVASGLAHVTLIENAVRNATDPRAGELAVRLAYLIASAKGTVASQRVVIAGQVAALARDRELAMHDLRDLLADANEERADVMTLLAERRALHAFRVEQPALAPLSAGLQEEAMREAPSLARALDTLDRVTTIERPSAQGTLVNYYFADRLAVLGEERPPLAQVSVTLRTRARVTLQATNEETLIASRSAQLVTTTDDTTRRANALAVLATAISLRTLGQDTPWFPGDRGPDAADLTSEFGLAEVSFSRTVPYPWRPYYLRELQVGLRDMQHALPALSVAGLHVRFGNEPLRDSALAMHDPRTRTLQLSISSSGGTLAHELAHDLDWQAARKLYANGSGYSTDRAMRETSGALSNSLRGLAEARLLRPFDANNPAAIGRPAEMFARGADWFVASVLAQQGRMNGFLSVISDGLLTGYAAGAPTAMGAAGAASLVSAIAEMTYLPDSITAGFMSQWSDSHVVDPMLIVRRVLDTQIPRVTGRFNPIWTSLATTSPTVCAASNTPAYKLRQNLLMLTVDARAAGAALRRAHFRAGPMRTDFANSVLGVPPWSGAEAQRFRDAVRASILIELSSATADQGLIPMVPATFCRG
jgi:hypothetical protein